jgi:hypothetical protein
MGRQLDVYRDWLDIPDDARPPNHYALLGIARGESRIEVIDAAADARLKIIRPRCLKYPREGTQLLNEVTRARLCLCDDDERLAYDRELEDSDTDDRPPGAHKQSRWINPTLQDQDSTGPALPAKSDRARPESETYALAETSPEPVDELYSDRSSVQGRWCPHCGTRLSGRATYCARCAVSDNWLTDWSEFKCRGCNHRLPAGAVICRKCKCDLAIDGARPRIPPGAQRVFPYFAAELPSGRDRLNAHTTIDEKGTPLADRSDRDLSMAADESTRQPARSSARDQPAPGTSDDDNSEHPWVVYCRENRLLVSAFTIIVGCGIFSSLLWLIDWNRTLPVQSPPATAATFPQQPTDPAPQAAVPSEGTDSNGDAKASSTAPRQTPESDRLIESALADLNDAEKTPADLLNRRREIRAVSARSPDANRFGDLEDKLVQAARERHYARLDRDLAAADNDDEFFGIYRELAGDVALEEMDSAGRQNYLQQLVSRWYETCCKQLAVRVSAHIEQQDYAAAWAERAASLPDRIPESFRANQQTIWKNYCELTVENGIAAKVQTLLASVDEKFRAGEFEEGLELATEFEDALNLQFQESPPWQLAKAAQRVNIHVCEKLTWDKVMTPLIDDSELERAQALVETILRRALWKSTGEKWREQLRNAGQWVNAPSPTPKKVKRRPFKDPDADYQGQRYWYRTQSSADPQGFDSWYKTLYIKSARHHAGFFVLVQGGQVFAVDGLAHAAYFASQLSPSGKYLKAIERSDRILKNKNYMDNKNNRNNKPPPRPLPVVPYWYGTREETMEAFPDVQFVTGGSPGSSIGIRRTR